MKDAKGHGSNTRGGPKLPRGTTAAYAGRDRLGRTYTSAIRDYDRFRSQNPDFPNAEDYRTDKTSNAQAAEALASTLKSTQVPVHDSMAVGDRVHLGFGAKGGAGYFGKLTKNDGTTAEIKHDNGKTYTGPSRHLSR